MACRCFSTPGSFSFLLNDEVHVNFGKEIVYGCGTFSVLVNIIWLLLSGLELAIGYVVLGCLWCITIVGIPFGKQCFKLAKLALMPFGASVV